MPEGSAVLEGTEAEVDEELAGGEIVGLDAFGDVAVSLAHPVTKVMTAVRNIITITSFFFMDDLSCHTNLFKCLKSITHPTIPSSSI